MKAGLAPTGKSKKLSSLHKENIPVSKYPKSGLEIDPVPGKRGVGHRHERWAGCGGRGGVVREDRLQGGLAVSDRHQARRATSKRTAKPCGSGTRCWCQVGGGFSNPTGGGKTFNPPMTVTRRIRRRGEHGISRKTIAQGRRNAPTVPVCSCACSYAQFARETAGAASIRRSLRPRLGGEFFNSSGALRRESADSHLAPSLRAKRSNPSHPAKKEWIASSLSLLAMTALKP